LINGEYNMPAKKTTKKTALKKAAKKRLPLNEVRKLIKRAQEEVALLLAHEEEGTISATELKTGLEAADDNLRRIMAHHYQP
jgi:hypothetical protein